MKTALCLVVLMLLPNFLVAKTNFTSVLLKVSEYKRLSVEHQQAYSRALQSAFLEFEEMMFDETHLSDSARNSQPSLRLWEHLIEQFQPVAIASSNNHCVIGGVLLSRQNQGGNSFCPTTGRRCELPGSSDNFKCGAIFNQGCVTRLPISSLSQRCKQSGANFKWPEYDKVKKELEKLELFCQKMQNGSEGCGYLQQRIADIRKNVYGPDNQFCSSEIDWNQQAQLQQCKDQTKLKPDAQDLKRMVAQVLSCKHDQCRASNQSIQLKLENSHVIINNNQKITYPVTLVKVATAMNCNPAHLLKTPTYKDSAPQIYDQGAILSGTQ